MDTKRCVYCHKLSLAEAESCSRCGHLFTQTTVRMRSSGSGVGSARSYPSRGSRPSIPPASPHRAGHHPGLHPEDQPYQSSMMEALRLPKKQKDYDVGEQGLEKIRLSPASAAPMPSYLMLPTTPPAVNVPTQSNYKRLTTDGHEGIDRRPTKRIATASGRPQGFSSSPLQDLHGTRKAPQRQITPTVLIIVCLGLLLISSLLAYLFINKKPELPGATLTSTPGQLRIHDTFLLKGSNFGARDLLSFTRDMSIIVLDSNGKPLIAHTDDKGIFSVQITVQPDWDVGEHAIHATDEAQKLSVSTTITIQQAPLTPPQLQLTVTHIDLGTATSGTLSTQNLILTNVGGGQINWQASTDQPWLTVAPNSGTFSGKAVVTVIANNTALAPQAYSGDVLFTQQGSNSSPVAVAVTMKVKAAPPQANLLASPTSLAVKTTAGQNSAVQFITLQNGGGQPLDWTVSAGTVDGANWLSVSPASGHLEGNAQGTVSVKLNATTLNAGAYQGTLTFSYGIRTQQVEVGLTVSAHSLADIGLQTNALSFITTKGTNPQSQTFSITDTGNGILNWSLAEDQNGMRSMSVTPASGSLAPGKSATIRVTPTVAGANVGTINAMITISDSDSGTAVQSQKIKVGININPVMKLSANDLTFNNSSALNITTRSITLTNTSATALDWTATPSALWLSTDASSGRLAPGESTVIYVFCDSTQLSTDTYLATLVVNGSNSSSAVVSQTLNVTLIVSA